MLTFLSNKSNLANNYDWQVEQVITGDNRLVTEGLLKAKWYPLFDAIC